MAKKGLLNPYDTRMYSPAFKEYFNQSDFFNFGYWLEDTHNQQEACENLVEHLLELLPEKQGTILDVACGKGATTRHLHKYFPAPNVVGITLSRKQIETSRSNAPGSSFIQMDAATLAFENNVFDNLICVEAVFHFNTRERFLREACRVLKPGGRLVLSDILFSKMAIKRSRDVPTENYVENLAEYKALFLQAGFQRVEIIDATHECWDRFSQHSIRWARRKLLAREISFFDFGAFMVRFLVGPVVLKSYLLVSASKV